MEFNQHFHGNSSLILPLIGAQKLPPTRHLLLHLLRLATIAITTIVLSAEPLIFVRPGLLPIVIITIILVRALLLHIRNRPEPWLQHIIRCSKRPTELLCDAIQHLTIVDLPIGRKAVREQDRMSLRVRVE
ncbi:hypothetical protein BJX64DRAFT_260368 [Aspergillus heterothallicus]